MVFMFSKANAVFQEFLAVLDTGTADNWISENVLNRLRLTTTSQTPVEYVMFNGKALQSNRVVRITWTARSHTKSIATLFRVCEDAAFEVVIGKDFLFSENIIIFNEVPLDLVKKAKEEGKFGNFPISFLTI
jgi:hypothetical protein